VYFEIVSGTDLEIVSPANITRKLGYHGISLKEYWNLMFFWETGRFTSPVINPEVLNPSIRECILHSPLQTRLYEICFF
jgi:hypothetical protein